MSSPNPSGGCGHAGDAIVGAISIGAAITEAAIAAKQQEEAPQPVTVLSHSAPFACTHDRAFWRRCLRAPDGDLVEFIDSDGNRYDCVERTCMKIPQPLVAWCSY